MNKKPICNKKMVRNTEIPLPSNVQIQQKIRDTEPKRVSYEEIHHKTTVDSGLDEPKENYLLCLEKKMKEVKMLPPRKINSITDLTKAEHETYQEKITKQMNYPFDKKLYKKLISLQLVEKPSHQHTSHFNYEPTVKDKIPRLEDFYKPTLKPGYTIPSNTYLGPQSAIKNYDGLRLHRVITTWKNEY